MLLSQLVNGLDDIVVATLMVSKHDNIRAPGARERVGE